ncbi:MAG: ammonium transporter, partial [Candidatus Chloroheliales bacterium]
QFRIGRDWDDALDVWGVHGVGGALGIICTGLFASAAINGIKGLVEGDVRQFGVQVLGVAITMIYTFVVTYGILRVINIFTPVRVGAEVEEQGLDQILHGEAAYDQP